MSDRKRPGNDDDDAAAATAAVERTPKRHKGGKHAHLLPAEKDIHADLQSFERNGLVFIKPYTFTFRAFAKGRWLGRELLEVLTKEFQSESKEYYERAISNGRIQINRQNVTSTYKVRNEDLLEHTTHRHEPPITAEPICVIFENEHLLVVNKPGSVPVHPTGRYRHNSVIHILSRERGLSNLAGFACHRLDRLTSGILLIAKDKETTRQVSEEITARSVRKEYLCRVQGHFPAGEVVCEEPIKMVNARLGVCQVDKDGKPSRSVFQLVHHDATSSVVRCLPETGRMHQLRVHLAHLGHPVVNDPLYGREGPRHVAAPTPMLDTAAAAAAATPSAALADIVAAIESRHAAYDATFDHVESAGASAAASEATDVDPFCFECTVRRRDPQPAELFLCLHASRYTGADWDYTAPPPPWAQVGFEVAAVNVQLDIENDEN